MKWYSENNVRNHINGHIGSAELLKLGVDAKDVATWNNPAQAAENLLIALEALPNASAFQADFGLVASQNRALVLWALRRLSLEAK